MVETTVALKAESHIVLGQKSDTVIQKRHPIRAYLSKKFGKDRNDFTLESKASQLLLILEKEAKTNPLIEQELANLRLDAALEQESKPHITKSQFYRLLEGPVEAKEVCLEFYKSSPLFESMVEDRTIDDIARWAGVFAKDRRDESRGQKFLIAISIFYMAALTVGAQFLKPPLARIIIPFLSVPLVLVNIGLSWLMTFLTTHKKRPADLKTCARAEYAPASPPIFHAERKIMKEVKSYLECRYLLYEETLNAKLAEDSRSSLHVVQVNPVEELETFRTIRDSGRKYG